MRIYQLIPVFALTILLIACGSGRNEVEPRISGPSSIGPLAEAVTPAGGIRTPERQQGGGSSVDNSVPSAQMIITLKAGSIGFSETELQAPAYSQLSVIVENEDDSVTHNFSLYRTPNGEGPVFTGGTVGPNETRAYTFTTPEPGTYYFRDDKMPALLNGTLEVE